MHIVMAGVYPREPRQICGGVEAVVFYLSQALQRYSDLQIDVITMDRWGLGGRTVRHGSVTVHYVPSVRLPSRLCILGNIRRMRDKILSLKPDLVHAHVAGQYAAAAEQTGLPWVLTIHGIRFLEVVLWQNIISRIFRGRFIKREEFFSVREAKHVISISPFVREVFSKEFSGDIYDIENPVHDSYFNLPENGKTDQVLFVGRMISRKGVHTLLRAFSVLHEWMPWVTLHLAGGGVSRHDSTNYYNKLKQIVADANLEEAITFLGELDEPTLLTEYSSCSVLVLSSVLETAPMVIMQAMAAGKAVVSTDAGGARYLVEHGRTGFVVPPNDQHAMAVALQKVLSDKNRLKAMGRRGKTQAEQRFHPKVVGSQTRDVYYKILGQMPPRNIIADSNSNVI